MLELCSDFTWLSNLFNPKTGIFFYRYSVFKGDNASLMTIGAGLCSKSDPDYCPSFVTLLDNAILRIPKCLSDGSFEWPTGKDVFLVSRVITLVFFCMYFVQLNLLRGFFFSATVNYQDLLRRQASWRKIKQSGKSLAKKTITNIDEAYLQELGLTKVKHDRPKIHSEWTLVQPAIYLNK